MRDILPEDVLKAIRDRYLAGVADAEAKFRFNRGSEDSLTGALGSELSMPSPMIFRTGPEEYEYQVYYQRVRGQGPRAPEKTYGADGIFQIEVRDSAGRTIRRKGLPFQAKVGRAGGKKLVSQARSMIDTAGQGLIVEYTQSGYKSISAMDVVERRGRKRALQSAEHPLGQVLGNEFLECRAGIQGLYYNADTEEFETETPVPPPEHVITTAVKKRTE
jgi:hypothetical protein